jgi:hypothetical protein
MVPTVCSDTPSSAATSAVVYVQALLGASSKIDVLHRLDRSRGERTTNALLVPRYVNPLRCGLLPA